MTDPLTGKELVQKSYDYVDKLTKECAKTLLEEYNRTHRKFHIGTYPSEIASGILQWFDKRDRNVRLSFDPTNSVNRPQPTQAHMTFKGNTKDADFVLESSVNMFVVPGSQISNDTLCFAKSLTISADRSRFTKRK